MIEYFQRVWRGNRFFYETTLLDFMMICRVSPKEFSKQFDIFKVPFKKLRNKISIII